MKVKRESLLPLTALSVDGKSRNANTQQHHCTRFRYGCRFATRFIGKVISYNPVSIIAGQNYFRYEVRTQANAIKASVRESRCRHLVWNNNCFKKVV